MVASGAPVLQRYGVSDDDAFSVGLTCGGILDVFVETVSQDTFPDLGEVSDDIEAGRIVDYRQPAARAMTVSVSQYAPLTSRTVTGAGRRDDQAIRSARSS